MTPKPHANLLASFITPALVAIADGMSEPSSTRICSAARVAPFANSPGWLCSAVVPDVPADAFETVVALAACATARVDEPMAPQKIASVTHSARRIVMTWRVIIAPA